MKLVPVRELENKMNEIENSSSWSNKIEQMKETKELINKNIEKLDKLKDKISNPKNKRVKKYKNLSLDELLEMFEDGELGDQILLYQQINYLITEIEDDIINPSETSESDLDSN